MPKTVTIQSQQRWDYCFETRKTENALLNRLVTLGQEGWELVNVLYYKDLKGIMSWIAFLKRPTAAHSNSAGQTTSLGDSSISAAVPQKTPSSGGFDLDGDEFQLKKAAEAEPAAALPPKA